MLMARPPPEATDDAEGCNVPLGCFPKGEGRDGKRRMPKRM